MLLYLSVINIKVGRARGRKFNYNERAIPLKCKCKARNPVGVPSDGRSPSLILLLILLSVRRGKKKMFLARVTFGRRTKTFLNFYIYIYILIYAFLVFS